MKVEAEASRLQRPDGPVIENYLPSKLSMQCSVVQVVIWLEEKLTGSMQWHTSLVCSSNNQEEDTKLHKGMSLHSLIALSYS